MNNPLTDNPAGACQRPFRDNRGFVFATPDQHPDSHRGFLTRTFTLTRSKAKLLERRGLKAAERGW